MNLKQKPALTLAEILITFGVIAILGIIVASIYFANFRLFSNQSTSIDVASQNKIAIDELTNQIRESQSVVATCSACAGDTTGSQVLILQVWPLNAQNEPFDPGGANYDYMVYKLDPADNTKLQKKILPSAGSARITTSKDFIVNVSSILFEYDNADVTQAGEVTVTITNSANSISKQQSYSQSTKATLRNK